jgi:hypothetical protein
MVTSNNRFVEGAVFLGKAVPSSGVDLFPVSLS